uniref:Si:ch73-236c18.9 n=1 Tax=Sinocyclocheilus rhinocerous TaxID=307959 RepID=A0A673LK60_9TELE
MELHPLLVKIIDTPQFQRLRHIKQLGGTYLVYPGASHNRFEHSLGVAYLAGRLVKVLHNNQPELKMTKQDFLCVQIAGLCHDLGHGPFSHVFDGLVIPEHEQMSVLMFDDIVKSLKDENEDVLKEHGLDDKDATFIKELIEGAKTSEWTYKGRDEDKSFLYEIVANKQNGIDVDKWDYFMADKYKTITHFKGLADNVYDMFRTRYTLHRQAYQHKIYMLKISEAIKTAEDYSELTGHTIYEITYFLLMIIMTLLSDEIFEQILSSTADNLKKSRDILNKIVRRKLPKFVAEARLTENSMSKAALEKYKPTDPTVSLNTEDLPVYVVDLDHGMKDKNPIKKVFFYSKRKPNKAFPIKDYQVLLMFIQRSQSMKIYLWRLVLILWRAATNKSMYGKPCIMCYSPVRKLYIIVSKSRSGC